jgi:hypothetical protein
MGSHNYSIDFSDTSSNSSWGNCTTAASRTGSSYTPRRKEIASRQKSPGPRCFPIARGRRDIRFPERTQADIPGIPFVRLDPLLERYGRQCRLHSGYCPQEKLHRKIRSVSRTSLNLGAVQGCPFCILGYLAANMVPPKKVGSERKVYPRIEQRGRIFQSEPNEDGLELYTTSGKSLQHSQSSAILTDALSFRY